MGHCLPQNLLLKSEQQFRVRQYVSIVVSCADTRSIRIEEGAAATGCAGNRRPAKVCGTWVDGAAKANNAIVPSQITFPSKLIELQQQTLAEQNYKIFCSQFDPPNNMFAININKKLKISINLVLMHRSHCKGITNYRCVPYKRFP